MPRVSARGSDIYYEVRGQGEPLVLLHNGLGCVRNFSHQMPEFSKHFRTFAYDRQGYGRSTHMTSLRETWLDDSVADLSLFLDLVNVKRAHLCGVCAGGAIALLFAAQNPARVRCVAVAGTCCYGDEETDSRVLDRYPPPERLPMNWQKELSECHGQEYAREFYQIFYQTLSEKKGYPFTGYDLRPILPHVKCPVMVVYGDRDRLFDLDQALTMRRNIKNSDLCVIPDCDHLPNEERPQDFNREIIEFIQRNSNKTGQTSEWH